MEAAWERRRRQQAGVSSPRVPMQDRSKQVWKTFQQILGLISRLSAIIGQCRLEKGRGFHKYFSG
jgi:hypothetical protein